EHASADEDLAGEGERADVVLVEHRDVVERLERALGIALLAEDARHFPVELRDLLRVVRHLGTTSHEIEELVRILAIADAAEEAIEGGDARRVAREARVEGGFDAL